MKIRLGEPTFVSVQGEGLRTGVLSVWHRFFGCSLRCPGFSQKDPADPSTYIDPLKGINPKDYISIYELPVVAVGCDSIYSIDPRFKHCAFNYTTAELVAETYKELPGGKFKHPVTGQTYDWCVTGGEPLMQQPKIIDLYEEMYKHDNFPYTVQIESNCTRALSDDLIKLIQETEEGRELGSTEWWFSMSPKLFHVSGEPAERAWFPEIIKQYWDVNRKGWLKFVITNDERAWKELADKVAELKAMGIDYPVMVMPVGALAEQQEDVSHVKVIAERAIAEGYHVSGRLHAVLFGNEVCT